MCDECRPWSYRRFGGHGVHHRPFFDTGCCAPFGESKETRIKRLEALKSHLQDRLSQLDRVIKEIQNEEEA
ncbi:MAG: hypothetical protein ACP6KW_04220 [Candidatus Thorarchaeota archaeon]